MCIIIEFNTALYDNAFKNALKLFQKTRLEEIKREKEKLVHQRRNETDVFKYDF